MNKRILLADDDASVRETLGRVLTLEHYDVVLAGSGCEAVERFNAARPDLVMLDLDMPDQDGWQAFDAMSRAGPGVPVVIITGVPNQAKRAVQAGAAALMEKPPNLPRLLQTIGDLIVQAIPSWPARTADCQAMISVLPVWSKARPECTGGTC
jgi:two-component system response regulator MprA